MLAFLAKTYSDVFIGALDAKKSAAARAWRDGSQGSDIGFDAAMGKGKNRCYVMPSLELVVIRMGDSEGREFSDNEFLAKLLLLLK